jgi:hypothetical protein
MGYMESSDAPDARPEQVHRSGAASKRRLSTYVHKAVWTVGLGGLPSSTGMFALW